MKTLFYSWEIHRSTLPRAIWHIAFDRFVLRRNPQISFFKSLGTGTGERFTPADANSKRWALLVVIDDDHIENFHNSRLINSWRSIATSEYRAILQPLSSHGLWSRVQPFATIDSPSWSGKVVAITRARIKAKETLRFWRSVPPINESLHRSPGLIGAIGIGEAPIGLQGTYSIWESGQSLRAFAYQGEAHRRAIAQTAEYGWYSEELFARFALLEEQGRISTCPSATINPVDEVA